jgi:hypothetical protein
MPRWIEEDPKGIRLRLRVGHACTHRNDCSFPGIEVIDLEIDVGLLRMIGARPNWRHMIGRKLKCQGRATVTAQLHPLAIVALHLPTGDLGVELGNTSRVGAVEREYGELGNRVHGLKSTQPPESSTSLATVLRLRDVP